MPIYSSKYHKSIFITLETKLIKMKTLKLTIGLLLIAPMLVSQSFAQERDLRFETKSAMFAANEEWLTFACELPDGMVDIQSKFATEMYYYSRYGLGNLLFRSGMGVHMVNNPLFKKHAKEDKGMPWSKPMMTVKGSKKFMLHKVAQFKIRSGSDKAENFMAGVEPPKGAYPIYLEYASGVPTFTKDPQLDDFSTLRWTKSEMDKTLTPGAWGQSMMKQVLWARDFFTGSRTAGGITYLGNSADDGANGFRGSALISMALTKSYALKTELAYNAKTGKLGEVDPMKYDPKNGAIYYPHEYKVKYHTMMSIMSPLMSMFMKGKMPKVVGKFKVTDPTSELFDVASLLWAESEFYFFTDPKTIDEYDLLFGDAMWDPFASEAEVEAALKSGKAIFPAEGPHKLAQGITAVNLKNLMGLHFDQSNGTLVDSWHPETGKSKHISTYNAGMAIVALANTYHRLHDVEMLKKGAKKLLVAQANFLLKHQNGDGSIANGFSSDGKADKGANTLLSQGFAIRGWIAAYYVTKDDKYLNAANKTYEYMENKLWSNSAGVYQSTEGNSNSEYDGMNYGITIGALRELAITREGAEREKVVARLDGFFDNVKNKNGLQIAEITPTGDPIPSPEKAKEMMAKMEEMPPDQAMAMKKKMMDADNDGVPKPKFVEGTKHGAAPVTAGKVYIKTNIEARR